MIFVFDRQDKGDVMEMGTTATAMGRKVSKTFFITRPKPPFGRQGLAGMWDKDIIRQVHFGV